MNETNLPKTFCWSKIGTESGESLSQIIIRKERERQLGNGFFTWGIGNSLGTKIHDLVCHDTNAKILFSEIKSKAKKEDTKPDMTLLWTSFMTSEGKILELPEHVFITSRGTTSQGIKQRHYALICYKDTPLFEEHSYPEIDFYSLRNLGSQKDMLGYSQVTAVVERSFSKNKVRKEKYYPVSFSADLAKPYFVKLCNPVTLPNKFKIDNVTSDDDLSISEWKYWVHQTRKWACEQVQGDRYNTDSSMQRSFALAI